MDTEPHFDAAEWALELLADEKSTLFDRSTITALFRIGLRNLPTASTLEWIFLHLSELRLGMAHQAEGW